MSQSDPFAKLGALDQQLYQAAPAKTTPETPAPAPALATRAPARTPKRQASQSTGRATSRPSGPVIDRSPILGRPKSFYITEQQDRDLAVAVEQLAQRVGEQVRQKVDRSTVIRLLLELADLPTAAATDRLYQQFVCRLISQLTG